MMRIEGTLIVEELQHHEKRLRKLVDPFDRKVDNLAGDTFLRERLWHPKKPPTAPLITDLPHSGQRCARSSS
jgi:hypothetical protein